MQIKCLRLWNLWLIANGEKDSNKFTFGRCMSFMRSLARSLEWARFFGKQLIWNGIPLTHFTKLSCGNTKMSPFKYIFNGKVTPFFILVSQLEELNIQIFRQSIWFGENHSVPKFIHFISVFISNCCRSKAVTKKFIRKFWIQLKHFWNA